MDASGGRAGKRSVDARGADKIERVSHVLPNAARLGSLGGSLLGGHPTGRKAPGECARGDAFFKKRAYRRTLSERCTDPSHSSVRSMTPLL